MGKSHSLAFLAVPLVVLLALALFMVGAPSRAPREPVAEEAPRLAGPDDGEPAANRPAEGATAEERAAEEPPADEPEVAPRTVERDPRMAPRPGDEALVFGSWSAGGWTDLLDRPRRGSSRLSQALIGDRVQVVEQEGEWSKVRIANSEQLTGWLRTDHLTLGSDEVRKRWELDVALMVVAAPGVPAEGGLYLPFGSVLPLVASNGAAIDLLLPDASVASLAWTEVRGAQRRSDADDVLESLKSFRRIPYREGANTREAMDEVGLIHLFLRGSGLPAPRTLAGLARAGRPIPAEEMKPGDVVFFSTFDPQRSQPVLLLDDGSTFLEASPAQGVGLGFMEQKRNRKILEIRRYG